MAHATFAAGCFWEIEATFDGRPGILTTEVGYTGGTIANPSYEQVCTGKTGHAEATHIEYDPQIISYEQLLAIFWQCHNPTTLNRQGLDVGTQYRSAIFYHDEEQHQAALASKKALQASQQYASDIVTEIISAKTFYRAEEYHQQYLAKRGIKHCHDEPEN